MMKMGMPTLIELKNLNENINLCKDLGLDFVEINLNMPDYQPDKLDVEELKELQDKHKMFFTFHLPEDLDIGHFNGRIREANLKIIEDTIKVAEQVGAPLLNMHMGTGIHFTLPTGKIELYDKYRKQYIENIKQSAKQIHKLFKNKSIQLAIENTGVYNRGYVVEAVEILLEDRNNILTWDIGHDYSSNKKDEAFMTGHQNRVRHMHLHDAIGEKNHLELYSGEIELDFFLDYARKNRCSCVIETKTVEALVNSIDALRQKEISW